MVADFSSILGQLDVQLENMMLINRSHVTVVSQMENYQDDDLFSIEMNGTN